MAKFWSGWQDSNLRPPAPKAGAITGLRYTPKSKFKAESKGFEPLVQLPIRLFSKQVLSATQATLQAQETCSVLRLQI